MKPMLPALTFQLPDQEDWIYEIKYDGFRGMLDYHADKVYLWSRNGKDLLPQFPELEKFLRNHENVLNSFSPFTLDGELAVLQAPFKANFQRIQQRGRMRSKNTIERAASERPSHFLVFDILQINGKNVATSPLMKRKEVLEELFTKAQFPLHPHPGDDRLCQFVPFSHSKSDIVQIMKDSESEGIVAKHRNSVWESGKRTNLWQKFKNWKVASCFVVSMNDSNSYFEVGVWKGKELTILGSFTSGLDPQAKAALKSAIKQNYTSKEGNVYCMKPGICLDLYYLQWVDGQFRETYFKEFRLDLHPDDCTFEHFLMNEAAFPANVQITHPEKRLWEVNQITKLDYVRYLRKAANYMLPFLRDRALTVIRSPHGVFGESFYQKNRPEGTPDFVLSEKIDDIDYMICNDLKTLIWFGNQLAIEFHIPFQTIKHPYVSEIVFDLDPPDRSKFNLAVKAASLLKKILDEFHLTSFIKLSGNKGIQVYIPLPEKQFNWEDTRLFTSFVADFLVQYEPGLFTTERLKKNRDGRLYIDFLQHGYGKTIIAPYSVRNNKEGLVAAPIFWEELSESLLPDQFSIYEVINRLDQKQDPFARFFLCKEEQPFSTVLSLLKKGK